MDALELRIAVNVRNFARSVHFYEEVLGMMRVTAWPDSGEGPGIILRIGQNQTIELFGPPYSSADSLAVNGGFSIVISVPDVDAQHDQLQAAGVPIARGLIDNPWGDRSFGIDDPDGVRIWFRQSIVD
jgi:catechol 2,3-dioxygenase-like lactoylglutathione lyase family enzyme